MGTCLISHWPFNSQGSGRIFDQHKHGLWAPKGHNKRGRGKKRRVRKSERQRWKEIEEGCAVPYKFKTLIWLCCIYIKGNIVLYILIFILLSVRMNSEITLRHTNTKCCRIDKILANGPFSHFRLSHSHHSHHSWVKPQ